MKRVLAFATLLAGAGSPAAAQIHDAGPIEIPLRVEGGRLIVPVEAPDGSTSDFILTTGNMVTVLSESGAERLGKHAELTMGGAPVSLEDYGTVPDESLAMDGAAIDGMIGSNTLNQFDVLIDVPGGRLVLKEIGRSVAWEGMTLSEPIRLRIYHGIVLSFDVELNGKAYGATLDVGTPTLVVNGPVGTKSNIDSEGVGTLTLGSQNIPDLPVRVQDLAILQRFDPNGDGFVLVGAPLTYDCAISISWVHQELRTCVK